MSGLKPANAASLANRLFVPAERLGWQYVDPGEARESPHLAGEPQWHPPGAPDLHELHEDQADMLASLPPRLGVAALIAGLGLMLVVVDDAAGLGGRHILAGLLLVLAAAGLLAVSLIPLRRSRMQATEQIAAYERRKTYERDQYDLKHDQWLASIEHWDHAEETRRESAPLWYPIEFGSASQRVDVFGGTPDGWSGLLCTTGAALLETDTSILVVDFTEEDVTGPLCAVAAQRHFPVRRQIVPAHLEAAQLLSGLGAHEVAELVSESVDTLRKDGEDVELRMIDTGLVQAVASRLDEPITFGRLAAGLSVLEQAYDIDTDRRLSSREFARLSAAIDTAVPTERARGELQFLGSVLDMLVPSADEPVVSGADTRLDPAADRPALRAAPDPADDPGTSGPPDEPEGDGGMWPEAGLSVLRTEDTNRRRRDLVDRLMTQVLLHGVRRAHNRDGELVLVLAGADHIGRVTLELLARRCRQAGIRLILMLEHLRGDLQEMVGSSDSVTVFMRLGNAQEAAAAAEHIGRGHQFLLTQLSRQTGRTDTSGTSTSDGTNTSASKGFTRSISRSARGWLEPPSTSDGTTVSLNRTVGGSQQQGASASSAISASDGQTVSRVYEFTVEPARIQSMEPTSFLFVGSMGGQRRVVAGDCDPYVSLMPRVSEQPLDDAELHRREAEYREERERQQQLTEQAHRRAPAPSAGAPGRRGEPAGPLEIKAGSASVAPGWAAMRRPVPAPAGDDERDSRGPRQRTDAHPDPRAGTRWPWPR